MNTPRYAVEFECQDCGLQVTSYGTKKLPDPPRCSTCAWLAQYADPAEREKLREILRRE